MATENPKVSAYVPQAIKDRLIRFREQHNISESQAVTTILAEYFEMTEVLGRSHDGIAGVTLAGMQAIESKLASFMELVDSRLATLENAIQVKSELPVVQEELLQNYQYIDSLPSELPSEVVSETKSHEQEISELPLNLLGEPLQEIEPIPGIKLSKLRFGLSESRISAMRQKMSKQKMSLEEFTQWTKDKDPDRIPWKFIESPSVGYVPAEELSSEQKSSLLKWIKENIR